MRILYISISYVPSRSASSVHVMRMSSALARTGHEIELVTKGTPSRQEAAIDDDHAYYGVRATFPITKLARPAGRGGGLVYLLGLRRLLSARRQIDLVYSRDLVGAWLAARRGLPVVFEAHGLPDGWLTRHLARRLLASPHLRRLVVISRALADRWREAGLTPGSADVVVAHDAADPIPAGLTAAERPPTPMRAGYVGHLYPGRGIDLILELARRLPDVAFHLYGGRERELASLRRGSLPPNVVLHGFVQPGELPQFYLGLDCLLMPYQRKVGVRSGRTDTAAWMSPMKMFEYLAAGRPIISSDLPVLREVLLDGSNALLVEPDAVDQWVQALTRLQSDAELGTRLGRQAQRDFLEHHTWKARAEHVLAGLE